jgi:GNAT superfamily N-acetyltransferase
MKNINLQNGLRIRYATPSDVDELAAFNQRILGEEIYATWTRELMVNKYDSPIPDSFLIVEDTEARKIISGIGILFERMTFGGLPVPCARIDIVSTDPEYRGRGLVRALFEAAQDEFLKQGVVFDNVIGRPWFYHQLGEYAIARPNEAGVLLSTLGLPGVRREGSASYRIRGACPEDLPFCGDLYRSAKDRTLLFWYLSDKGLVADTEFPARAYILEDSGGCPAGFFDLGSATLENACLQVSHLEILPGICWLAIKPVILGFLMEAGERLAAAGGGPFKGIHLQLGKNHPFYQVIPEIPQKALSGFPGYVRVIDFPGLFRTLAPLLEERLTASPLAGYSGEFRTAFFKKMRGLRMKFASGRLAEVESCNLEYGEANLPQELFTQLVFGWKSVDDLAIEYPDCVFNDVEVEILFRFLFPKG